MHYVYVLARHGEEPKLEKDEKRAHRAGVVVAWEFVAIEELFHLMRPLRDEIAAPRVGKKPRNVKARFVAKTDEAVF